MCWGKVTERDHLEDLCVNGWIILKWTFKLWDGGMEWIDVPQAKDRWRDFVKVVLKL